MKKFKTKRLIKKFIKKVKEKYIFLHIDYEYDENEDLYDIWHTDSHLEYHDKTYACYVGELIQKLFFKNNIYNITMGYDYEKSSSYKMSLINKKLDRKTINKNPCCSKAAIKIMPDFSSSHLWCDKCNLMIEIEDLDIPKYIEILIENWGALWDIYAMSNHRKNDLGFNKEYLIDLYNSTGTCIQKELSKYYKCCFKEVENLWKL